MSIEQLEAIVRCRFSLFSTTANESVDHGCGMTQYHSYYAGKHTIAAV